MEKALNWICKRFKEQFPWILTFFAVAVLSIVFNLTPADQPEVKIIYIIALFLAIITILIVSYAFAFYKDYKTILLFERVPLDAEIEFFRNKIIFNAASLSDYFAETEMIRRLKNNMDENNYNLFKVEITSTKWVPDLPDITVTVEREKLTLDREVNSAVLLSQYKMEDTDKANPLSQVKRFTIPLNIEPGKSKTFSIMYKTRAYEKALEGCTDYLNITISRITHELSFEILLKEDIAEHRIISKCSDRESDGREITFHIFDGSGERMILAEKELRNNQCIPIYTDCSCTWKVENPKIGYQYRLYFTTLCKC
ncbi:MAG: hypothetical protein WC342_03685 [Methanoregula sp.]|jgi:hypothetical protein